MYCLVTRVIASLRFTSKDKILEEVSNRNKFVNVHNVSVHTCSP